MLTGQATFCPSVLSATLVFLLPSTRVVAQGGATEIVGHKLPVPGARVKGTTARLSEVEAAMVARLPPQHQAERLLQYAISHHTGATDEIKARVREWRGSIARSNALDTLMEVALNGSDLRVRAAACEISLAVLNIAKAAAQETVAYGYRALREITDETLPDDPRQWRDWSAAHASDTTATFRKSGADPNHDRNH